MKTESRFLFCSLMVGHDFLLKATSGPRRKKGTPGLDVSDSEGLWFDAWLRDTTNITRAHHCSCWKNV